MPEPEATEKLFGYRVLRYSPTLIRDEWVNVGIVLFDEASGDRRFRAIESEEEFARIRHIYPAVDENLLRGLRGHLEDRLETFFRNERTERGSLAAPPGALQEKLLDYWDQTLSNSLQLAPPVGVWGQDLDTELERLYADKVAPQRRGARAGAPGSRAYLRGYCSQVWKQARLWDAIQKSVRVSDYTFPGDPMRIDYAYQRNGTRGFVNTLSVSRSPTDAKLLAYTAARIAANAPFRSEFAAVTDVALDPGRDKRHGFVRDTLRDAGIEPVPLEGYAVWVARLKPMLQ